MMNVLDQLVDACLQFGRQPPDQPPPSFKDFVEPVYQLFQKLHEQYLENFQEYRAMLSAPGSFSAKAEALCARLSADHRFSADQEAKVILFMGVSRQETNLVFNGSFESNPPNPDAPDGWSAAGNRAVKQRLLLEGRGAGGGQNARQSDGGRIGTR
jgi:hypothetical protein